MPLSFSSILYFAKKWGICKISRINFSESDLQDGHHISCFLRAKKHRL